MVRGSEAPGTQGQGGLGHREGVQGISRDHGGGASDGSSGEKRRVVATKGYTIVFGDGEGIEPTGMGQGWIADRGKGAASAVQAQLGGTSSRSAAGESAGREDVGGSDSSLFPSPASLVLSPFLTDRGTPLMSGLPADSGGHCVDCRRSRGTGCVVAGVEAWDVLSQE